MDLKEQLENKLKEINYDLDSVKTCVEDGQRVLRIVVDRVEPIGVNDITIVTEFISNYLDEIDPFDGAYLLDVSSLGAEKPLKMDKLHDYINSYIHVHLINPIEGENIYEGTLVSLEQDKIQLSYRIKTRTKIVDIQKSNISKIRLAIKF